MWLLARQLGLPISPGAAFATMAFTGCPDPPNAPGWSVSFTPASSWRCWPTCPPAREHEGRRLCRRSSRLADGLVCRGWPALVPLAGGAPCRSARSCGDRGGGRRARRRAGSMKRARRPRAMSAVMVTASCFALARPVAAARSTATLPYPSNGSGPRRFASCASIEVFRSARRTKPPVTSSSTTRTPARATRRARADPIHGRATAARRRRCR